MTYSHVIYSLAYGSHSTHSRQRRQFKLHPLCTFVVRICLQILSFSLQSNQKTKEVGDHSDRDAQFEHINAVAKEFLSVGD